MLLEILMKFFEGGHNSDGQQEPLLSNSTMGDKLVKSKEVSIQDENGLEPDNDSKSRSPVTVVELSVDDMIKIKLADLRVEVNKLGLASHGANKELQKRLEK